MRRFRCSILNFAGIAVRMLRTEQRLQHALQQHETLTTEMRHHFKNLFEIIDGMIRFSARMASNPDEMAQIFSGRLHALADAHALVRRSLGFPERASQSAETG